MASRASSERPLTSNAMKEIRKLRAGENLFAWLMMALSLFVLIQAYLISGFSSISSAGMFPMVAAAIMVAAMALILLKNRKLAKPDADGLKDELRRAAKQVLPKVFLVYTGVIIAYMILIQPLHFLPSSFAFLPSLHDLSKRQYRYQIIDHFNPHLGLYLYRVSIFFQGCSALN